MGGNGGIGKAIAIEFGKEGGSVVIVGRTRETLDQAKKEIIESGAKPTNVLTIKADVSNKKETECIVGESIKKFGKLDILINNAGIGNDSKNADPYSIENYDFIFNVNVRAVINLTKVAVPHLKKTRGCIINISSMISFKTTSSSPYYAMSKASLDMYTKCLAAKLTEDGVRVNSINPGVTKTSFISKVMSKPGASVAPDIANAVLSDLIGETIPMKRAGQPSEIASVALFLAGPGASYMSGSIVVVDGGSLIADHHAAAFK
uniref:3-oxoacyl-[acyl-carrier-protein] reductase n=1 Tax=Rhabditophanes sp. KR3021 TaxID=114890 RepID=A0AC35TQG7_9BILA